MSKPHIILDFDGTIVSSMEKVFYLGHKVLEDHLQKKIDFDEFLKNFEHGIYNLYSQYGLSNKEVAFLGQKWEALATSEENRKMELFEGMLDFLEYFKNKNIDLSIWTARDRTSTLAIINDLGIGQYFLEIKTATCGPVKPIPDCLEEIVTGYDYSKCFMIGDSDVDVKGGKAIGLKTVGATWCKLAMKDRILKEGPDLLASSIEECKQFIDKILKEE